VRKFEMRKNPYEGKLIVATGVDGSGKTSLLAEAKRYLASGGVDCILTRMPSDRIRSLPVFRDFHDSHDENKRTAVSVEALTVLVSGDRLIVLETEVIPALRTGRWVLCDRYAYTGSIMCDDPLIDAIGDRFLRPDLVLLATASVETVRARVLSRPDERVLYYDSEAVRRHIDRYRALGDLNEFVTVPTDGPLETAALVVRRSLDRLLATAR